MTLRSADAAQGDVPLSPTVVGELAVATGTTAAQAVTRLPTVLDAKKEADRRQLGPLRAGAFCDGAQQRLDGVRLPTPSQRTLGWRSEGYAWAERALASIRADAAAQRDMAGNRPFSVTGVV